MNRITSVFPFLLLPAVLPAQIVSIFPDEYAAVPEGPLSSPNVPFAAGNSRVLCLYDRTDIAIASGRQITKLGFRQDATLTVMDVGRTLQLEVRMGYSTATPANLTSNFANTYASAPVTVFGPASYVLPNLRDTGAPLPNGQLWVTLSTPFTYNPGPGENLVVEYLVYGNSGGGTSFNYRLDRADFYSPVVQGPAGCPRAGGGVPVLTVQPVRPNQSYSTSLATGPGNSFAVLMLAPGLQLAAPFSLQPFIGGINPACTGQVPIGMFGTLTGVTSATGAETWSFLIPNNAALYADMYVASQCAIFDTFAPGGLVVSNGAQVRIGAQPRTSVVNGAGPPATVTTGTVTRNYCPVAFFEHQ
jgi:hypothetical protein